MLVFSETFEDIDRSNAIFTFHDSCPRRLVQERTGWLWHDWPEYSKGWAKMTQRVGLTWRMPDQQPYAVVAWKRQTRTCKQRTPVQARSLNWPTLMRFLRSRNHYAAISNLFQASFSRCSLFTANRVTYTKYRLSNLCTCIIPILTTS